MIDVEKVRADFPFLSNNDIIYFDNSATTLKPQCVIDVVEDYYNKESVNIERGDYDLSYSVSKQYENARNIIATFINAKSSEEIIFTSGATDSLNKLALGLSDMIGNGDVILTTLSEHASNLLPWFDLAKKKGAIIQYIKQDVEGYIDLNDLQDKMNGRVKLVTLASVSNVLGCIQPIAEISKIVHTHGAYLVVDGAQSVPHYVTDVQADDIDFLVFSGHKMCGPCGVGVLYGKYGLLEKLNVSWFGGGANARFDLNGNVVLKNIPERFEAGTPNISGVLGLAKAASYLMDIGLKNIEEYEAYLKSYLVTKMKDLKHITIYNPSTTSAIFTFNADKVFAQDGGSFLNTKKIAVRSGNHCAKILHNLINTDQTIRASLYFYNTTDEIDEFVEACKDITLENCVNIFF